MGWDLIIVHILFIASCVYFSYRAGQNSGGNTVVEALMDKGLITPEQLDEAFGLED